jgi:hypothetical protein
MLRDRTPRALAVVLVLGGVGIAGCSGGSSPVAATTVPTLATTTTSVAPTTTVYQPTAPQKTQDAAGAHLVAAWKAADRASASSDATPAAVDAVFAQPFPAGGVQARGCSNAVAGPSFCVYRILANGSLLSLSALAVSGGWIISAARFES